MVVLSFQRSNLVLNVCFKGLFKESCSIQPHTICLCFCVRVFVGLFVIFYGFFSVGQAQFLTLFPDVLCRNARGFRDQNICHHCQARDSICFQWLCQLCNFKSCVLNSGAWPWIVVCPDIKLGSAWAPSMHAWLSTVVVFWYASGALNRQWHQQRWM